MAGNGSPSVGKDPITPAGTGTDRRWEIVTVYSIGLFQGLSLVAFPAAATILTSPTGYDLSKSHYGLLPRPENRVTVDGSGNIHLAYQATNNEEADGLYKELRTILNHVGMADHHVLSKNFYMSMNVPVAGVAHQAGTCRFGLDPATSVLDANCKAHQLDNLYVVDTSFFPSIGAVNPALTAMANAIRVGEHLIERLG
jgi:choline dehydrogenase-like flavoprotein